MQALTFWKTVTRDQANLLERLFALLDQHGIRSCVIGGQAVNAYVEPLVGRDLDLVVSVEQIEAVERLLARDFTVKSFPHSLNLSLPGSDLRVQIQTDPRYTDFVERAALDPTPRASKRQKDLADIARLIEAYPQHRSLVPDTLLARLV